MAVDLKTSKDNAQSSKDEQQRKAYTAAASNGSDDGSEGAFEGDDEDKEEMDYGDEEDDYDFEDDPGWEEEITKPKPAPTAAPAAQAEIDSFLKDWNKEIKGGDPEEPAWRRPRSPSPDLPPRRAASPPHNVDLLAAARKREVELARSRLVIPASLRRLLGSPSASREFLTHPAFTRADLCQLARVASPFLRPIQRLLFTNLVIKTPSQLSSLGSLSQELLKEIGSVTIALGDLRAQAGEMPLLRATMDSICESDEAMGDQGAATQEEEADEYDYEPTAQELAERKREHAYRVALELLDDGDALELCAAIRLAYDDVPYSSSRVGGGTDIALEAISADALSRSLLNKLEDVVIVFPASSLAKDLFPVLSKSLTSLEIINPRDASQYLALPLDLTLRGGPGQLPLAREGLTAIHRIPPSLLRLTLEGVTLVPNELSGYGVKFDRAAPHDLVELSLTRVKYESGGSLKDFRQNLESTRVQFGPQPPSDDDSPPPLVSADAPTSDRTQSRPSLDFTPSSSSHYAFGGGTADSESTRSPWDSFYQTGQLGSAFGFGSWRDRNSWNGDSKGKMSEYQEESGPQDEGDGNSSSKKLDLHLFLGAGNNILRILKLDSSSVQTFEDQSIVHAIEANAESLEELIIVEEAELDQDCQKGPQESEQDAPDLIQTTFSLNDENDFGDDGFGGDGLGEGEMEQSEKQEISAGGEDTDKISPERDDGEPLDSSFKNLALDSSATTAEDSTSAVTPPIDTIPFSTSSPITNLSPFATALAGCSSLHHLRLSNRLDTHSTYPADIVDALLLAKPPLSVLEIRVAAPALKGEAAKEWRKGWELRAKEVLELVEEYGIARITLVEEVA